MHADTPLSESIQTLCILAHENAKRKGFWEIEKNDGECIALMHSELSEALEALRNQNPLSTKIPEFSSLEEELADVLIRVFDYAGAKRLRLGKAVVAKMEFNLDRQKKHGKEF